MHELAQRRLATQRLFGEKFEAPAQAVGWLGAVQAQDFAGAKWALGLRVKNATDNTIEQAFNEGKILRTHVLRPTWHFVLPEDIRWLLELTAPQVKKKLAHYDRRLDITEKLIARCEDIFRHVLKNGNYLTRTELAEELAQHTIEAKGQRLGHLIMHPELNGVICSGPRRGKQFTYALVDERAPQVKGVDRDEAMAKLAMRYVQSHGPIQVRDFSWWSGLSMTDARQALNSVKSQLIMESIEGKEYWSVETDEVTSPSAHTAWLLSIFDEYSIAYNDRSVLGTEKIVEKLIRQGPSMLSIIVLDGQVVGNWKRTLKKNKVEITLSLFSKHDRHEINAINQAAEVYGKFLQLPVELNS